MLADIIDFEKARRKRRDPPIAEINIEGKVELRTDDTQKLLGPVAWDIWNYSLYCRNTESGESHLRYSKIREKKGYSRKQIQKASTKLYRLGFWRWIGFAHYKSKKGGSIPTRIVYGTYRKGQVRVPGFVSRRIRKAPQKGGERPNAGRPRRDQVTIRNHSGKNQKGVGPNSQPIGIIQEKIKRGSVQPHLSSENHSGKNQKGVGPKESTVRNDEEFCTSGVGGGAKSKGGRSKIKRGSVQKSKGGRSNFQNPGLEAVHEGGDPVSEPLKDRVFKRVGFINSSNEELLKAAASAASSEKDFGRAQLRPKITSDLRSTKYPDIAQTSTRTTKGNQRPSDWEPPLRPHNQRLRVPRTPNPPKIPDDLSDVELAELMMTAYRAAYQSRYKEPCMLLKSSKIQKSKYFKRLVDSGDAMIEHGIAPMAWCAFAIDTWRDLVQANRRKRFEKPPLNYVFSANFIREKRGWFRTQAGNYGGGRPQVSAECREVQDRWRRADRALRHARLEFLRTGKTKHGAPEDINDLESVRAFFDDLEYELFSEQFPGGWEVWYEKAIDTSDECRARLKAMVARGEFVWSD